MPLDASARPLRATAPELSLPPPFTLVRLRELGDAFAHAQSIAAEAGAGTLVHVGRFDLAEFALVLEPEEPLATSRRAFIAGMAALADALAAYAQPETLIEIHWPGALTINLGLVGGRRTAAERGQPDRDKHRAGKVPRRDPTRRDPTGRDPLGSEHHARPFSHQSPNRAPARRTT